MARYGMVIDLFKCIGCDACTMACKSKNTTAPGVFWARVLEKEVGKFPTAKRVFLPVLCNHCDNPPCVRACPTGATFKRPDGIVDVDYAKCMGCRACMEACPYGAHSFLHDVPSYIPPGPGGDEHHDLWETQKGVVQKCNFCVDRLGTGRLPACVEVCPTDCRIFGDLEDPNSRPSRILAQKRGTPLRPEEGTNPQVIYV